MKSVIPFAPVQSTRCLSHSGDTPSCNGTTFLPRHLTPARPHTYTIEVIAACNHQCVGCGNVFDRRLPYMPASDWQQLLRRIQPDITGLRITGGECTLHPDFAAIIRMCDQLDVPFVVFTNGHWRQTDALINLFAGCRNLHGLLISLHGHTAETYRSFVTTNAFHVVTDTIYRACCSGVRVVTNTILLQSNVDYIDDIAALSFSLGASAVAFSRYYGHPLPELELPPAQLQQAIRHIAARRAQDARFVFNNCVPFCFSDDLPTRGCTSGFTHGTIDPLGYVRPCTHAPVILGNALEQDMETIWNSALIQQWRSLIPTPCITCRVFDTCRGGCRATAYQRGLQQDPLMVTPIDSPEAPPPRRLRLYRHACPRPNYTIRQNQSGWYLVNHTRQVAVSERAVSLLEALNGQTTLAEIYAGFGQVALDFIGSLVLNGLVELV